MCVAAEGAATQAQADFLADAGCDELHGCHLGRPMSTELAGACFDNQVGTRGSKE